MINPVLESRYRSGLKAGVAVWLPRHEVLPAGFWSKCQSVVAVTTGPAAVMADPVWMDERSRAMRDYVDRAAGRLIDEVAE